jgi:hypothetical protein
MAKPMVRTDGEPAPAAKRNEALHEFVQHLKQRYEAQKGSDERSNCNSHWQEIAEVISPRKADFLGRETPGRKKMQRVYDATGIHANEMLAAGLHGMATNPASTWFSLRMVTDKAEVDDGQGGKQVVDLEQDHATKSYLSDVEKAIWQRIYQPGTNFTTSIHEFYLDLGAFGTAIMYVGQRVDGGLLFETLALSQCFIAENVDGRVDTLFRKIEYTVRTLWNTAKAEGWELSDHVKTMYKDKKYDEKVCVVHAVFPSEDYPETLRRSTNMAFASVYFEHEACHPLKRDGMPDFPFLCARFSKYPGELYGHGPGMTALPDVKMLQMMTVTKIKLMQKAADPVMWLRDDGVIGQQRNIPGGINYWRGNPNDGVMLQPVSMQGLNFLAEDLKNIREQILRAFYADIMRMSDRADMTATEVVQRTAEQMRLFGPLIGRLESEFLGPLVSIVFGILHRLNLLPAPPKQIQDQDFTVEYVSPVATAQKQQSANGIVQVMQLIGMFGPEIAAQIAQKNLDIDKFFAWCWDLFNCDPDLLKDEEGRDIDAQETQAQKALMMGQPAMDMMGKGAKAVKDVADAQSRGGLDVAGLVQQFQAQVANDPRSQEELRSLMSGQAPTPAAA